MNKCAWENVRNHLEVKMLECEKAKQQAKEEGKTVACTEMYQDMSYLYARLVLQLKQMR